VRSTGTLKLIELFNEKKTEGKEDEEESKALNDFFPAIRVLVNLVPRKIKSSNHMDFSLWTNGLRWMAWYYVSISFFAIFFHFDSVVVFLFFFGKPLI
jgi:hypothetical protein